nr:hypothetical protein BaRGS_017810 [Batillaria attramentaria]
MVCLTGPPGTGKTLLLVLKGLCWLRQGHDVHVVSLDPFSSATSRLIVHQLRMTLRSDPVTDTPMPRGKVLFHQFDFYQKEADVEADIKKLCAANQDGRMFVLVDEADFGHSSRDKTAKPPPLRYRDVFVLTRSELSDVITDDNGQVTSRPCDFVAGLRASGVPVRVVWWKTDMNRYVGGLEDLSACKVNQVTVTDWDVVTGLERKVVVYLPGRYPGVDDWRGDSDVHDSGKVYAMSRCTSQLVLVDLPHIATGNDETEVETWKKNKTL